MVYNKSTKQSKITEHYPEMKKEYQPLKKLEPTGVFSVTTSTPTQIASMKEILERNTMTEEASTTSKQKKYPHTICYVLDSLVNHFPTQGKGKALKTKLAELFSTSYYESSGITDPRFFYSKTSEDFSAMIKGLRLESSSNRFRSWGIYSNGKCLTANIGGFPKTDPELSLSDILEESVDEKYYLSQRSIEYLMRRLDENKGRRGHGGLLLRLLTEGTGRCETQEKPT